MENLDFYKFILPLKEDLFDKLSDPIDFEGLGKGRKGNQLVDLSEAGVPIVRTTSKYEKPAHNFSAIHHKVADAIKSYIAENKPLPAPLSFNNALVEIYEKEYTKMKYHSDQCLDLEENSYIALFSCYERAADVSKQLLRKLKVKNKETGQESVFTLTHNSVILFSLSTNSSYQHKIVLEAVPKLKPLAVDNRWLGLTFRKSKTRIHFKNNLAYFSDGKLLKLADEAQKKEFYRLRGEENRSANFIYPDIAYTLSPADTMMPNKRRINKNGRLYR